MSERKIMARGLTPNDFGKSLTLGEQTVLLRNVEHFDGRTVLTVVTTFEVDPMTGVVVHE